MTLEVKICGITDAQALQAAVKSGASYVGFVFCPPSPRALTLETAQKLAESVPSHVMTVGLLVDPKPDELLALVRTVPLGLLQLHGKETPEQVAEIRRETLRPVMKAIGISGVDDFAQVAAYEEVADMLLFDAKPPAVATRPGGNAKSFDWTLLKGRTFKKPWMLAGGLNAQNLAAAVTASDARTVDVSSGVEDRPGHKDPDKIRAFMDIAKDL